MSTKDNNPLAAQRVKVVHTYRDVSGHNAAIGSTSTITALTGAAIIDTIGAVWIANVGNAVMYLEPQGTAGADSFPIPPGGFRLLTGRADELQLAQLFSAGTTAGFMYMEVYQ